MEVGNKISITDKNGDKKIATILGETEKMWRIVYNGETEVKRLMKNNKILTIEVIEEDSDDIIIDTAIFSKIFKFIKNLFD